MKKMLIVLTVFAMSFSGYSYIVTEYFGIFNDWDAAGHVGLQDNFNPCLALNPPYNSWDVTMVCFLVTKKDSNGKYIADFENQRGTNTPNIGDYDIDRVQKLKTAALAVNPNMKFIISLGYGKVDNMSFLVAAAQNPADFAKSVCDIIENSGLDGFDIDYEGENVSGFTQEQFNEIIAALRTELDSRGAKMGKKLYLTLAPNTASAMDFDTVNKYVDFVQMQTYDYSGDMKVTPSSFASVAPAKLLFGRDIENGDTLTSGRHSGNVGNVPAYVEKESMAGIMGWRVNSSKEMKDNFEEVNLLGNSLPRTPLQ